jgi:cysteinyl-tRNA synthetase
MSKSLGNFFTIDDVLKRQISPQALRLLFLTTHYRSEMNFKWDILEGMQKTYFKFLQLVVQFKNETERTILSDEKLQKIDAYRARFFAALENDLDTAEAVTLLWEVSKSNIPGKDKYDLLIEFDEVLGLGIRTAEAQLKKMQEMLGQSLLSEHDEQLPSEVKKLLLERKIAREAKDFLTADALRVKIAALDFEVEDTKDGQFVHRK